MGDTKKRYLGDNLETIFNGRDVWNFQASLPFKKNFDLFYKISQSYAGCYN